MNNHVFVILHLQMPRNFSKTIHFDKQKIKAVFIPIMKSDGLHYEININGFHRFYVAWTELGRYDIVAHEDINTGKIPYNLILAVSDVLEKEKIKK